MQPPGESAIYEIVAEALLSGRLVPGAKLGEQKLAAIFGVSRERIRKVLQRLGHERLIDVVPNRGAFVGNPGLEDAREIYEARRVVEAGIAWQLAAALSAAQLEALREHFRQEEQAHRKGNRVDAIRLSGAFHSVLAAMTRNALIVRQMQELVSRTSMLVALFEDETVPGCGVHEHGAILRALETADPAAAARAMILHLSLVETRLRRHPAQPRNGDLEGTLREGLRRYANPSQYRQPARTAGGVRRIRSAAPSARRR